VDTANLDQGAVIQKSVTLANKLQAAGMSISSADRFVIVASQMLIAFPTNGSTDFDSACHMIQQAGQAAQQGG
jgi:hypothetical protein